MSDTPKGYWIGRLTVSDPERYKDYVAATAIAFAIYKPRFLVRGGHADALEGVARPRNVVVEFSSFQTALDCWNSPEYQAAFEIRKSISEGDIIAIEGYQGAQPAASVISGPVSGAGDPAYWVMRVDMHDPDIYKSYVEADAIAVEKYRGWFVVRGGAFEALQGSAPARNVVLAFANRETAEACYNSPEYQLALGFRKRAATADVILVDGYTGPQPG